MRIRPLFILPLFITLLLPGIAFSQLPDVEIEEKEVIKLSPTPKHFDRKKEVIDVFTTENLFERMYFTSVEPKRNNQYSRFRYYDNRYYVKPKFNLLDLFDPYDGDAFWQLGHWGTVIQVNENHLFQHKNFTKWMYTFTSEKSDKKLTITLRPARVVKSVVKKRSKNPFLEFEFKW